MGNPSLSRLRRLQAEAQAILDDRNEGLHQDRPLTGWPKVAQFLVRVYRGFLRNRGFVRAAALAYTTVLALVPLIAIAISVSAALLKQEGEEPIRKMIDRAVGVVAPMLNLKSPDEEEGAVARERLVRYITDFVENFKSGTLGTSAVLMLIFVAISLLSTIESTLNDLWGVPQGRGWITRVMAYWLTLTLGPLLLASAFGITGASQVKATTEFIQQYTLLDTMIRGFIFPFLILTFIFFLLFLLMPNTRVEWRAALCGGAVTGFLLQLNTLLSMLYVTKVGTEHKIYKGISIIPLFLAGLYISWVIVLIGAQVAYAFQNRRTYAQQRLAESVNQRGREFIAMRLMTYIAQRFSTGGSPPTSGELSDTLGVPLRLVGQILTVLAQSKLIVEVTGDESGYTPARPIDAITAQDIIDALRSGQGQELDTCDDPSKPIVRGEFETILEAERQVAGKLTLQQLVEKTS